MKERILEFLKAENKSSAQLAEEIGVQPSGISHILSGRNNPSLDFILKMLEKYKFLSTDWLLFGKGNMYGDQGMQNLFQESLSDDTENKKEVINDTTGTLSHKNMSIAKDSPEKNDMLQVERIVWFYDNGTFKEYIPEK